MEPQIGISTHSPLAGACRGDESNENARYEAAIGYLYGRINYEKTADTAPYPFRLRRMLELLDRLDLWSVAGRHIPVIHIAGTKGKGSTSSMIAAMLSAGGYRTGLYTSPHLVRLEERFCVDGSLPTAQEVVALVDQVRDEADRMAANELGSPTFFELTTALALLHFRNRQCDAVVLEVGLGGRLDSTNVCLPAVTAITSIGLDHQHILGNTHAEIAYQKAGIIKPNVPVVCGVTHPEARDVIARVAAENSAPLFQLDADFSCRSEMLPATQWGTQFTVHSKSPNITNRDDWTIPLEGHHQGRNASVACAVMDLLTHRGVTVSLDQQRQGLSSVRIAGRVERFPFAGGVDIVLDTAHNVDSIEALCQCIQSRTDGRPVTIIFGTSRDKDHIPMLNRLGQVADRMILSRYHGNPRYRDPKELLADGDWSSTKLGDWPKIIDQPIDAMTNAVRELSGPHLIVICGSFFLAAEVRPLLLQWQSAGSWS